MRVRPVIGGVSVVAGVCVWLASTTVPVTAHHAFAAEFDADRPVEFSGTVTKVEWDQSPRLDPPRREERRRHDRELGV